jgi:hypothetical protein
MSSIPPTAKNASADCAGSDVFIYPLLVDGQGEFGGIVIDILDVDRQPDRRTHAAILFGQNGQLIGFRLSGVIIIQRFFQTDITTTLADFEHTRVVIVQGVGDLLVSETSGTHGDDAESEERQKSFPGCQSKSGSHEKSLDFLTGKKCTDEHVHQA